MIVQNWWSASVQGASPLQGGSQILYSLFSGLAMLYIYIISIGCYISIACHYRRIFVQCLSPSAYICPMPVTIGVYLSNACHYRRIFVQCLSLSAYILYEPRQTCPLYNYIWLRPVSGLRGTSSPISPCPGASFQNMAGFFAQTSFSLWGSHVWLRAG